MAELPKKFHFLLIFHQNQVFLPQNRNLCKDSEVQVFTHENIHNQESKTLKMISVAISSTLSQFQG